MFLRYAHETLLNLKKKRKKMSSVLFYDFCMYFLYYRLMFTLFTTYHAYIALSTMWGHTSLYALISLWYHNFPFYYVSSNIDRLVIPICHNVSKKAMFLRYAHETLLNINKKKGNEIMRFKPKISVDTRDLSL